MDNNPKRTTYNRKHTIQEIRHQFIILYDKYGMEKLSVQQVCQQCGISRTIFYKYFDDKYSVLESIEDEIIEGIRKINQRLPQTSLYDYKKGEPFPIFADTAEYIKSQEHFIKPLIGVHSDPQFIARWRRQIRNDMELKFNSDNLQLKKQDLVTAVFASAIIGLYTYWFFENPGLSADEVSTIAGNLLCGTLYDF